VTESPKLEIIAIIKGMITEARFARELITPNATP
jgi:hypothetical protein